jgi:hypothetical protein
MNKRILLLAKLISLGVLLTLVVLIPGGQTLAQDVLPPPDQPLSLATQARELGRVHYAQVALAGLAFIWFLHYRNLLEELWF